MCYVKYILIIISIYVVCIKILLITHAVNKDYTFTTMLEYP